MSKSFIKKIKISNKYYLVESDDSYLAKIQDFEPNMISLYELLLPKNSIVCDIGANIGCTSIFFSKKASKVFSFEPSESTFKFLKTNILSNKCTNVELFNIACGSSNTSLKINFSAENRSGAYLSNDNLTQSHLVEDISVKTLDKWWVENGKPYVSFLKIDVEGYEKDVLTGGLELVKSLKPIVLVELNHWCLNVFQRITVPDYLDFLRSIFPYLYAVDENTYGDLHNRDDSYHIMYQHILYQKFPNIVGAFSEKDLDKMFSSLIHYSLNKEKSFKDKLFRKFKV
jgi:FkbM family methyltransferase